MNPIRHLQIAIIVVLIAGVCGGWWYTIVRNERDRVVQLDEDLQLKIDSKVQLASARTLLVSASTTSDLIQQYIVPEDDAVVLIEDLEARGRALSTNVAVTSVTASGEESATLALILTIRGTFDAVVRTVGAIEYAPYHLRVSSLLVMKEAENLWRADMKIVVGSAQDGLLLPRRTVPSSSTTTTASTTQP